MHNRISLKQLLATTSLFCLAIGANVAPATAAPDPGPSGLAVTGPTAWLARTEHLIQTEAAQAVARKTSTDPKRTAFDYFVHKGLSKVQAAGIVGNLVQESGVKATAVQGNGPGRGIAQWSIHQRWDHYANDNLTWFASRHHASRWSLDTQLDFLWYELKTFQHYGLGTLRATRTVSGATKAFQDHFEGCGKCDSSQRLTFAQHALKAYGNGR
jgi:Phage tail lysozyme